MPFIAGRASKYLVDIACTAAFDVQEWVAFAVALLPVGDSDDSDVDNKSNACCQTTDKDDSNPARCSIEEGECSVAKTLTGLDVAEAIRVLDLRLVSSQFRNHEE